MPTQPIRVIQEPLNPEELSEELAKLQKLLRYLLNGQLDFENIRVKGIKAETIDVDQLSAISADLGTINAGIVNGVTINGSTINGGTINVRTDVNVGNKVVLNATTPFVDGGIEFKDSDGDIVSEIKVQSGDLRLKSTGYIFLNAPSGVYVTGDLNANGGITTSVSLMGSDGITPVTLYFTRGMLSGVS